MVKNSLVTKLPILQSILINMHHPLAKNSTASSQSRGIFIYLESACLDEQNGNQSFKLRTRIADSKLEKLKNFMKKIV